MPPVTHSNRVSIRRFLIAGAAAVCGVGIMAGSAYATPPEGDSVRTELAQGTTDAPVSIVTDGRPTTLYVQSATLHPGASSGWHTHPGPEYSVVTDGTVAVQTATDCTLTNFVDGQAVFIPGGMPHRVANTSPLDASVVVTYTLPADVAVRGDAPDACAK